MPKYKVWRDNQEQWDANDIDPPTVIDAGNQDAAAELFAEHHNEGMDDRLVCVVQDEFGKYFHVEVSREWRVRSRINTSLQELCAP